MRRGEEISCLAWAGRETAAISQLPWFAVLSLSLLKDEPTPGTGFSQTQKTTRYKHTCSVGRAGMGSCLTRA